MPLPAPPAAKPTKQIFDPFNSSATGHQRAENRLSGSTSWRESRSLKLREQFTSGVSGGKRVSDTVGAGSLDFGKDGRTENGGFLKGAKGLRTGGQRSLWEVCKVEKEKRMMKKEEVGEDEEEEEEGRARKRVKTEEKPTCVVNPWTPYRREDGKIRESSWTSHECSPSDLLEPLYSPPEGVPEPEPAGAEELQTDDVHTPPRARQIFANCNFYINGSTYPLSDHKIKHLLASHGGNVSIALGRKTVTHVIIGKPNAKGGCGGGLAGSKIQKEIEALRGKVKFVTAEWISESVKAGKRLPESRFEAVKLAPKAVGSINTLFKPRAT